MSACATSTNPTVVTTDLHINQFASFEHSIQLVDTGSGNPTNIVSWSFYGSLKANYDSQTPLLYFTSSVDVTSSIITFTMTPAQTATLTENRYVYDLVGVDLSRSPDTAYRLEQGKLRVHPGSSIPTVTE